MKEKKDSLFNILNMRNNKSFNNDNDNLNIEITLNVSFTSHTMSVLFYEIVKLSQEFPNSQRP